MQNESAKSSKRGIIGYLLLSGTDIDKTLPPV
jgi:hypothetical protein